MYKVDVWKMQCEECEGVAYVGVKFNEDGNERRVRDNNRHCNKCTLVN